MKNNIEYKRDNEKYESIHILKLLMLYPLALILLFEEWGWEPLSAFFDQLAAHPLWAKIEKYVMRLPSWSVLFVFGVPVLALLPIKFFALYLFGEGHILLGSFLLITTKLFGTAICARLFKLTKPALMEIGWFAYLYPRWKNWKDRIISLVRKSGFWLAMHRVKLKLKKWWTSVRQQILRN